MSEIEVESDHPILFIYDPGHQSVKIPAYIAGTLIAQNRTCVSIGTQHYLDGPTKVNLGTPNNRLQLELVYEGNIETPSRVVAVSSSEKEGLCSLSVRNVTTHLKIWADDLSQPGELWVDAV